MFVIQILFLRVRVTLRYVLEKRLDIKMLKNMRTIRQITAAEDLFFFFQNTWSIRFWSVWLRWLNAAVFLRKLLREGMKKFMHLLKQII